MAPPKNSSKKLKQTTLLDLAAKQPPSDSQSVRRSSRARKSPVRPNIKDFDQGISSPTGDLNPKTKKRKTKSTKTPPAAPCPHCGKAFTSAYGLQYHVDQGVCQKKKKTKRKPKIPDPASSSDDDDEDDRKPLSKRKAHEQEESDDAWKNTKQPRKKSKTKKQSASSKTKQRGPKDKRTCPHCKRVFTSLLGLNYHVEKAVCLTQKKKSQPFHTLQAGECFSTAYGVVEVIDDSQAVPTASAPDNLARLAKRFSSSKLKRELQVNKSYIAQGVRSLSCRSILNDLYEDDKITQTNVFTTYYGEDPRNKPRQLYNSKITKKIEPLPRDPAVPENSFPDRLVTCKLIPDRRQRFTVDDEGEEVELPRNMQNGPSGINRLYLRRSMFNDRYDEKATLYQCSSCGAAFESSSGYRYHQKSEVCIRTKKKVQEIAQGRLETIERRAQTVLARHKMSRVAMSQQNASSGSTEENSTMFSIQAITEDLSRKQPPSSNKKTSIAYLKKARKNPAIYPQVLISMGFKLLAKEEKPMTLSAFRPKGAPRSLTITGGKSAAESTLQKEGKIAVSKASSLFLNNKVGDLPISPYTILMKLKWELKFEQSRFMGPVYPAVFRALKFKKPLSELALKRKRDRETKLLKERKETLRKKLKEERKEQAEEDLKRQKEIEREAHEKREYDRLISELDRREAEKRSADEKAAARARKRRKLRRKMQDSTTVQRPLPPLVDVRVLVAEVDAGRYPSMKALGPDARRAEKCFICKLRKKHPVIHNCTYCPQVFHWKCARSRFTMKDPEPEDVLMCPKCIGLIQSRRTRAEKRRIEKHDNDGCVWTGLDDQEAATDAMRLSTGLVQGREYECVAAQARSIKELAVLLQDTQTRLSNCLERGRINSVRQDMVAPFEAKSIFSTQDE